LIFVVFSWFLKAIKIIVPDEALARYGFGLAKDTIDVDEDLPYFYEAIKLR
jgi:hypothetical protein